MRHARKGSRLAGRNIQRPLKQYPHDQSRDTLKTSCGSNSDRRVGLLKMVAQTIVRPLRPRLISIPLHGLPVSRRMGPYYYSRENAGVRN